MLLNKDPRPKYPVALNYYFQEFKNSIHFLTSYTSINIQWGNIGNIMLTLNVLR